MTQTGRRREGEGEEEEEQEEKRGEGNGEHWSSWEAGEERKGKEEGMEGKRGKGERDSFFPSFSLCFSHSRPPISLCFWFELMRIILLIMACL